MAEGAGVQIKLEGVTQVVRLFDALPEELQKKVMRPAVKKGAALIAAAIRTRAAAAFPNTSGSYKRSIGVRVRYYKESDTMLAVVGPRRGAQYKHRANIAHLLEWGWRTSRGGTLARESGKTASKSKITGRRGEGTVAGRVAGRFLIERAYAATRAQVDSLILTELRTGVERTVRTLNSYAR